MSTSLLSRVGEAVEGTAVEPYADRLFYRLVGPRRVESSLSGFTGTFDAWSSREYHGVQTLDGEAAITESLLDRMRPTDTAWDVGANVGWHSVFMGRVAPTVAFEPSPDAFPKLHRNVTLNPESRVVPVCAGISQTTADTVSTVQMSTGAGAALATSPAYGDATDEQSGVVVDGGNVESLFAVPDVVKVDVQGIESVVVESFGELLDSVRLLMLETHQGRLAGDWTATELHDHVCDHGFSVVDSDHRRDDVIRVYEA